MDDMPVQLKDARDLKVGDYIQVIDKEPPLTVHLDLFRRVEHVRVPADPANTLTYVWCHGVTPCLALPQGDVEVWVDVPQDRREEDETNRFFGNLDPPDGSLYVGLPEFLAPPDYNVEYLDRERWRRHLR
jgi:hypothetical protein